MQISSTLAERMDADCSLPPATENSFAPGYKIAFNINDITAIKDFDQARTNVAYT